MNCDGVRGLLSAYLDGELSSGDLLRVEQHLRHCHWCADEVDSLRQTVALVSSLDEVELPPMFHAQLHHRLVALGPPEMAVRRISGAPSRQKKAATLRWAVPAAAAAAALAIGLTSYPGKTLPGLDAPPSSFVVDPASPANPAPSAGTPVAVNNQGTKANSTQPSAPVDSGTAPKQPDTTTTGPVTDPAPLGTQPSGSGDGAHVTTIPQGGKDVVAPTLAPKLTYTAELSVKGRGPEFLTTLQGQYQGSVLQGETLVISVPTQTFADTLKAVATSLGLDTPAPVSFDLAPQIKAAEDLLQADTTALKNFETEYGRMNEAAKADAKSTLDHYAQQVVWDEESLAKLNQSAMTSTITVQLQPAAR